MRYTIRIGIEPSAWSVTIHPGGIELAVKRVYKGPPRSDVHRANKLLRAAGSGGRAMTLSVLLFGEFLIEFL